MGDPDSDIEALIRATSPGSTTAEPGFDVAVGTVDTPIGDLTVALTERGVLTCQYEEEQRVAARLARTFSKRVGRSAHRIDAIRREVEAYFAGRLQTFTTPPDLRLTSDFARAALRATLDVPYGSTITYRELAARIGRPQAVRAVANALNTNPVTLVLPCHRVVPDGYAADGDPGSYAGGEDAKLYLLTLEEYAPRRRATADAR